MISKYKVANKNIGHPVKLEFHVSQYFKDVYPKLFAVYLAFKFNWASYVLSDNLITKENVNAESKDTRNNAE